MPLKRGASKSTPPPYTAFRSTRPKYGVGGKPTGKAAYISARHGAGMKNLIRKTRKQPKRYSGTFDKSAVMSEISKRLRKK